MTKRLVLVAVWAVFASAAVGVGFGAAGLIGVPFSAQLSSAPEPVPVTVADTFREPGPRSAPVGGKTATASPRSGGQQTSPPTAGSPDRTASPSARPNGSTATRAPSPAKSSAPSKTGGPAPTAATATVRDINTRGGYVQARCSGGLVSVSVSPAVGWELDEMTDGSRPEAEIKFAQVGSDGDEVVVKAECTGGAAVFEVGTEEGSGGSGEDGSGSED